MAGSAMLKDNHWECKPGDMVSHEYFNPPCSYVRAEPKNPRSPLKMAWFPTWALAFYKGMEPMMFRREAHGQPWIRTLT